MEKKLFKELEQSLKEMEQIAKGELFGRTSIYKLDSKGKQRIWTIWVEGNPESATAPATIKIESGLVDGKKVNESLEITSGKNLGKANATTPYTQAVSEAKAKLELKLRGEYVKELSQVSQGVLRSGIAAPMLAQKYHPTGAQSSSKTLEKMKIKGKTIHVQPKFDGQRCLIKITPDSAEFTVKESLMDFQTGTAVMYTRKGDVRKIQFQHILKELLENYKPEMGDVILDGELFSSELSFNEANGLLNKKEFTPQEAERAEKLKFHLYDTISDESYDKRYEKLKAFASSNVDLVPSYEIVATDENIKEKLEEFLAEGHEGLMIRTLDKGYENKRSWSLVKVKLFEDAEYKIVGLETNSLGRLGGVIVELPEPTTDRNGKTLTTFKAGLGKGISHEDGMQMLNNEANYIGKMATVEYFGKSEYGIPRFPKFKALRED
jgi:ATP-dependent DNA ligase